MELVSKDGIGVWKPFLANLEFWKFVLIDRWVLVREKEVVQQSFQSIYIPLPTYQWTLCIQYFCKIHITHKYITSSVHNRVRKNVKYVTYYMYHFLPRRTSGGRYQSVTTSLEYVFVGKDFALANPKSANFNSPFELINRFWGCHSSKQNIFL